MGSRSTRYVMFMSLVMCGAVLVNVHHTAAVGTSNLDACVSLAQPLLSENHLVVPSTRHELHMVCNKWRLFVECINKYVTSQYSIDQKSKFNSAVQSAITNVHKMCNDPVYSTEYLRHAPCIKQMTMQDDKCGEYYRNMARVVTEAIGSDEQVCCLHRKFRSCMSVQRGCSTTPASSSSSSSVTSVHEFVETFLDNGLHVFSQKCTNYVYSVSHCAGASRHNRLEAQFSNMNDRHHQDRTQHQPRQQNTDDARMPMQHRDTVSSDGAQENRYTQVQQLDDAAATTAYRGWFSPESTTSVWLAAAAAADNGNNSGRVEAQRQHSSTQAITLAAAGWHLVGVLLAIMLPVL